MGQDTSIARRCCYNAQAVEAEGSLLVVATDVAQATDDKQQLQPMLNKFEAMPDELGQVTILLADTGYFSAANVSACAAADIEAPIAMGRQPHYPPSDRLLPVRIIKAAAFGM